MIHPARSIATAPLLPAPDATVVVRLPKPLHAALRELAFESRGSMNALLVRLIEREVRKNPIAAAVFRRERDGRE